MMRKFSSLLLFFIVFAAFGFSKEEARLLRFPAIYGDQVVFTYAGDLYTVDKKGGIARKLTGAAGYETFARFSPDGKRIAFTGQYDGNTEVYVIPAEGGVPERITVTPTLSRDDVADRMGPNNIVMTWKDNETIVFRSRMKSFNSFIGQLYTVKTDGSMPEQIEVPRGGFCSFSPDGKKMAYNRIFREFRTWKRYRGGMADDVWIYDFKTKKTVNITNNPAQDIIPMWLGGKIYFLSDRGENKRMNLYSYDLGSKETKQLTFYKEFDIKFPSAGKEQIIFENGGYIYTFDIAAEKAEKISVTIAEDLAVGRDVLKYVGDAVSNYEIAPDGKRALFGARGDVFTVPARRGITVNLTQTPGVHERASKWSPDGKWIAYISDRTGEDEIYIVDHTGAGEPVQITRNAETYKYQLYWSPDSRKILWSDRRQRLRFVDIRTKKITEVDHADAWEIRQYTWSPDSKWISYTKPEVDLLSNIYLYSLIDGKKYRVTDGWYQSGESAFSDDGKFLLFTSNRDFKPVYSWTEWNHAYIDMSRIYLLPLNRAVKSPFEPENDMVSVGNKKKKKKKSSAVNLKIDTDNMARRLIGLPIAASAYGNVNMVDSRVYYIRKGSGGKKSRLMMYDLDKRKEKTLGEVSGYEISADKKKMLISRNRSYAIINLPKGEVKITEKLKLRDMKVNLNRKAEWTQIFNESWRQMREYFYAPNMHGVDWKGVREKYAQLLPFVNHRNDLTYIIGEMISELNIGHAYVGGGDRPKPRRIKLGLLGAVLSKDGKTGFFRLDRILAGQNWRNKMRSPLTESGVEAKEGEYIVSIDGKPVNNLKNIYSALIDKADKPVMIGFNGVPSLRGAKEKLVVPISSEADLYYYQWVQGNIEKVNKATKGKVGYVHIPDMGVDGLNEFVQYFYPQIRKKGLIIDVRGNGGGNVSPMIIERLRREIAMIDIVRNGAPTTDPKMMFYGPLVCLADEFSASDGDIFTYRFKYYKLGKVIGKRTWGGVVGIRGSLPFVDGGTLNKPEFSRYDVEGKKWIMEGVGVEPDIYVDNDPAKEYAGTDQQLNKAIEVILEELKTEEKVIPPPPPYPVK